MKNENGVIELSQYRVFAGMHINTVCQEAIDLSHKENAPVHFVFNETDVTVQPYDSEDAVVARWEADRKAAHEAYINSDEYKQAVAKREADEKAERERVMTESALTESDMRTAEVPWPKTEAQLLQYIQSLVNREHDYGTCVYAASMAATAAFHYIAGHLGMTGFQAGCADLDIIRRTRSIKGPFMLTQLEDMLYPQYDLHAKLDKFISESGPFLKSEAEKKLAEKNDHTHPDVVSHWQLLAQII